MPFRPVVTCWLKWRSMDGGDAKSGRWEDVIAVLIWLLVWLLVSLLVWLLFIVVLVWLHRTISVRPMGG